MKSKKSVSAKNKNHTNYKVGIVTSRFNEEVTSRLRSGALAALKAAGYKTQQIVDVQVAGAFEIPLAAQWLFDFQKCEGVIALGAVIRGETSHYDYVCSAVERGCTMLQLQKSKPVIFGVLTTENEEQAINRAGGSHGHKGVEAVQTLIEMLSLKKNLKTPTKLKENSHG